jgi:hypothetical protein
MIACASADDIEMWKRAGRVDILHIIDRERAVWMGDHLVSALDGRERSFVRHLRGAARGMRGLQARFI